jgi:hypothetical protein
MVRHQLAALALAAAAVAAPSTAEGLISAIGEWMARD